VTHGGDRRVESIIDQLDLLIDEYITQIRDDIAKHAKAGDLIRMIELRHKLMPDSSRQKEFWKVIEDLRREKLPENGTVELNSSDETDSQGEDS
jgi:hypothetical protein